MTAKDEKLCNQYLGGLWTLPVDGHLNFNFQAWRLRNGAESIASQLDWFGAKFKRLSQDGGSFRVVDSGNGIHKCFTYGFLPYKQISMMSVEDAEDAILDIPPIQVKINPTSGEYNNGN
jgi:hypothetical protein